MSSSQETKSEPHLAAQPTEITADLRALITGGIITHAQALSMLGWDGPTLQKKSELALPTTLHLKAFQTSHDSFECDGCKERVVAGTTLHGCRLCDYDLCSSCFAAASVLPCEWEQVLNCPNANTAQTARTFKCSSCSKDIDMALSMHGCRECNYDSCKKCYEQLQHSDNPYKSYWHQDAKCPNGTAAVNTASWFNAAKIGDEKAIRTLIDAGGDVNEKSTECSKFDAGISSNGECPEKRIWNETQKTKCS